MALRFSIILYIIFVTTVSFGQNRREIWSKVVVNKSVNNNLTISSDFQHRRQSNYLLNETGKVKYPLTNSVRIWFYLKRPDNLEFFISPFAFFKNYDFESIDNMEGIIEYRFNVGLLKRFEKEKLKNNNRLMYETRFIQFDPSAIIQHRYRLQTSLVLPIKRLTQKLLLNNVFSNELFIASSKRKTFFDQNRLYNALQFHFTNLDANLGYQWTVQNIRQHIMFRNQIHASLTFNY